MTPAERTMRARTAALTMHAQGLTNTAPARAAFEARFLFEVDPDGILPERERFERAAQARRAYFTRLAMKSAAERRRPRHA